MRNYTKLQAKAIREGVYRSVRARNNAQSLDRRLRSTSIGYTGAELRALRAVNGCGRPPKEKLT